MFRVLSSQSLDESVPITLKVYITLNFNKSEFMLPVFNNVHFTTCILYGWMLLTMIFTCSSQKDLQYFCTCMFASFVARKVKVKFITVQ